MVLHSTSCGRLSKADTHIADNIASCNSSNWGGFCRSEIVNSDDFKNWNTEQIENVHSQIEFTGMKYISFLQQNDLCFWNNETDRDRFSFFLSHQYFRTKNTRDGIIAVFEKMKRDNSYFASIRPENMWLPLSLILASNVGAYIANKLSAILLQAEDSCFVVGDQPVVNTFATFDMMTSPNDIELFYPITPCSALLLTSNQDYSSGQIVKINMGIGLIQQSTRCSNRP